MPTDDREARALRQADQWLRDQQRREDEIRGQGANVVLQQSRFFRRGLVLLHTALIVGIPAPTNDLQQKVVLGFGNTQADLLESGWSQALAGHYAAATAPLRLINELCDFIPAAAADFGAAKKLLTNGELRVGDARKILERELQRQGASATVISGWVTARRGELDGLNSFVHARTPLLVASSHIRAGVAHSGHAFNARNLWIIASEYARQSVLASISIGIALNSSLPDEDAWSVEQASLLADWRAYQDSQPEPPLRG